MKILTDRESRKWMEQRGLQFHSDNRYPRLPPHPHHLEFQVSKVPKEQIVLAHELGECVDAKGALLWLYTWPIFTEQEMGVFIHARRRHRDSRRLIDAPGHLFEAGNETDKRDLTELVSLMFAFTFEGYLFENELRLSVWPADEIVEVATDDKKKFEQV